jgi:hypothetical protein
MQKELLISMFEADSNVELDTKKILQFVGQFYLSSLTLPSFNVC